MTNAVVSSYRRQCSTETKRTPPRPHAFLTPGKSHTFAQGLTVRAARVTDVSQLEGPPW
jgi:hypothetical protein